MRSHSIFKIIKTLCATLILLAALLIAFCVWAVGTVLPQEANLSVNKLSEPPAQASRDFKVMTYNIGFAQGVKNYPTDWRDADYTRKKLDDLAQAITAANADVLLLQEVDIDANRSFHMNQAKILAEKAQYPFSACAPIWDKNYVPYPFFPIAHQIGMIQSALCVFSRFPLSDHKRIIFDKPESNPFWYNLGYIDRGAQRVLVDVGGTQVAVVNTHLEAWDENARQKQVKDLMNWLKDEHKPLIIGGDFNTIPPEATQKIGFVDEPDQDYRSDSTILTMRNVLLNFTEAIPTEAYLKDEANSVSFPSNQPTRKLEHLFGAHGITISDGRVVHEALEASDHLPLMGIAHLQSKP